MISVTVEEIVSALGAELSGPGDEAAVVAALTVDSRIVVPGALFVALPGEHVDGHDYVAAAITAGAVAALTRRPVKGALCLVVVDPLVALGRLSRYLIDRSSGDGLCAIGITGSVGKTSTKDLLAQVLEQAGPTVAAAGNLNNEIGVPLTVGHIDAGTRFVVLEMGARGIGHIAYLCDIAPPRVGVVLNVGQAHVGEFGGQAAIAQAKGELVESLPADGWAVLNIDDPLVWAMRTRTKAQVLPWSSGQQLEEGVWASGLVGDAYGRYSFTLHQRRAGEPERRKRVQLALTGRHHVPNAGGSRRSAGGRSRSPPGRCCARRRHSTIALAHGAPRPLRWRHGDQRFLQRQPGLDARRAEHPRRAGPVRPAHLGRTRRHARARRYRRR